MRAILVYKWVHQMDQWSLELSTFILKFGTIRIPPVNFVFNRFLLASNWVIRKRTKTKTKIYYTVFVSTSHLIGKLILGRYPRSSNSTDQVHHVTMRLDCWTSGLEMIICNRIQKYIYLHIFYDQSKRHLVIKVLEIRIRLWSEKSTVHLLDPWMSTRQCLSRL